MSWRSRLSDWISPMALRGWRAARLGYSKPPAKWGYVPEGWERERHAAVGGWDRQGVAQTYAAKCSSWSSCNDFPRPGAGGKEILEV
jgi:hypothetical protein